MRCLVCSNPSLPGRWYCARCYPYFVNRHDNLKRRVALREAYDPDLDGFRCRYTRVPLEETDARDPFHLTVDHLVPVRSSRLVATSELLNSMKSELGPEEFPLVVRELSRHHAGRPFRRDVVAFEWWGRRMPPQPESGGAVAPAGACEVCGGPRTEGRDLCRRCYDIVRAGHTDFRARARALKEAWSPEEGRFLCHFTGAWLEVEDVGSPWYVAFGHRVPGDDATLVAGAWWVTRMKEGLEEGELWLVVGELDACWREGREFERDVVEFKYWRRIRSEKGK